MYASLVKRGVALFVDAFIVCILVLTAALLVELVLGAKSRLISLGLLVAYFAGFTPTKWQATPGKHVLGLKITGLAGERIGVGRSLLRFAASLLSIAVFGLGYAVSVWNGRRQALHDLLAGTVVVESQASSAQIAQSRPPRPSWKSGLFGTAVLLLVLASPVYVYLYPMHGMLAMEINDHNMAEALPVVAALDAYKQKNGRYPDSLALLHPRFLGRLPQLAPGNALHYAASPAGDQCWLAIVYWHEAGFLPSDRANEYECASRSWTNVDYDDLHAKNGASFTEGTDESTASGKR